MNFDLTTSKLQCDLAHMMHLADGVSGGRPVAPALLIKIIWKPASLRERGSGDLLMPNWFLSVAGLHVPLIKGIHFVHPNPCWSKVKLHPMVQERKKFSAIHSSYFALEEA